MPLTIRERQEIIRDLKALDARRWAHIVAYHEEQIRKEESK